MSTSKKGMTHFYRKNWRPFSLLDHDYKPIAKLIAEVTKLCLDTITDIYQTGFIKGRYVDQT